MKTIGLIGGVSAASTVIYYQLLNEAAAAKLGATHTMPMLIASVDFGVILDHYNAQRWDAYADYLADAGRHLKAAGADALMIGSNTSHLAAERVVEVTGLPIVHMLDAVAEALTRKGAKRPLLTGMPFVMQPGYYQTALAERYAGELVTPDPEEQKEIERIIVEELIHSNVTPESRRWFAELVTRYAREGADGVILGCTELSLILTDGDVSIPVFDTTALHAAAAARYALED